MLELKISKGIKQYDFLLVQVNTILKSYGKSSINIDETCLTGALSGKYLGSFPIKYLYISLFSILY